MDQAKDLLQDIHVTPVPSRPGVFRATLDHAWSFLMPSGGVLTSVALGAMRRTLADIPARVPVAATATFCSAVAEGPLEVEVQTLRAGKTAHQLRAHVRPLAGGPGDVGLEVTATFADPTTATPEVKAFITAPSDLPRPDACPPFAGRTPPPFYRNLEVRRAHGDVWWAPQWEPDPRTARWFRYLVPPRAADGMLDVLAIPPIADTMASAVHQAFGSPAPGEPSRILPSLDLTLHFVTPIATPADGWILVDSHAHAAFAGQASARAEVWDADGRLLALATQTMTIRTLKPR